MNATIRTAGDSDARAIAEIYNHYIEHTVVTFEEELLDESEMQRRVNTVAEGGFPWLVAERESRVVGYAYASAWKNRSAYRFSTEATVYLAPDATRHGIGSALYRDLFSRLQSKGIHAVMGGIALPNDASVAIHEKFGFKQVAHFAEVGFKFNRWIDVGYWQRVL